MKIEPKKENEGIGYSYTVTDEQIQAHQKLSLQEICHWLDSTRKFVNKLQTQEEKEFAKSLKNKKITLE